MGQRILRWCSGASGRRETTNSPGPGGAILGGGADAFLSDLELLLRARHPLIFLDTDEKDRAHSLLLVLADRMELPLWRWFRTEGLRPQQQLAPNPDTLAPFAVLGQVVLSALYAAFAAEVELTTALLLEEAARAVRLACTMREQVEQLRAWVRGRTVPAHRAGFGPALVSVRRTPAAAPGAPASRPGLRA